MLSGIYCIKNVIDGKRYIGSSINLHQRRQDHFKTLRGNRHASAYLQHAFNKYSEVAFSFDVLLLCEPLDLLRYEQALIDLWEPEYNICKTAGNRLGMRHTDESKRKMSETKKARMTDELRAKNGDAHRGNKFTPEQRQRVGDAHRGLVHSKESRRKCSEAQKGRVFSEGTRKKMSESAKIRSSTKEWRDKYSLINKTKTITRDSNGRFVAGD